MKKKLLAVILSVLMVLTLMPTMAFAASGSFTDVKASDWYYNDVKSAVELGLVNGKTEKTFAPGDNLTYAEAVKLAACMYQLYTEGSITLKSGSPWYQPYVDYCKTNKIIQKNYSWDTKATREGYMDIFARALPDEALEAKNVVDDGSIPDVPMTNAYAEGIYKLYRAGILQGSDEEHNCNPSDNIKRSEVAAILTRMMTVEVRITFEITLTVTTTGAAITTKPAVEATALKIEKQPEGGGAYIGDVYTLDTEVSGGTAPFTYYWQYDERGKWVDIEDDEIFAVDDDVLKVTMSADDARCTAKIQCIIGDSKGQEVVSDAAQIYGLINEFDEDEFLMYSSEIFWIKDRGLVFDGIVLSGELNVGDTVSICLKDGTKTELTVESLSASRESVDSVTAGDDTAILFGMPYGDKNESDEIKAKYDVFSKGDSITKTDSLYKESTVVSGTMELLASDKSGRKTEIPVDYKSQYGYGNTVEPVIADITGQLIDLNGESLQPGETRFDVVIEFSGRSVILYTGQQLVVRDSGRTIGTFTINEVRLTD